MTSSTPRSLAVLLAALLPVAAFAQGALTPPAGAPAPTMKSLDQIEARTIMNAANTPGDATHTFLITAPGSYYLTGNLTGAAGILAGDGCMIAECAAGGNGTGGILIVATGDAGGTVVNSNASNNGTIGIFARNSTVAGCSASFNGSEGISANGGNVTNSTAIRNASNGIYAPEGSLTSCVARLNGDHGIWGVESVIAFCKSDDNNQKNNGSLNIYAPGATGTGNK